METLDALETLSFHQLARVPGGRNLGETPPPRFPDPSHPGPHDPSPTFPPHPESPV